MTPNINLLPKIQKEKSDSGVLYIALGAITVLALAFMAWQYFSARAQLSDLTAQESTLQQEVTQLQAEYDTLVANQNKGSLESSVTFVERVSYAVTPLIDEMQKLLSDNTYLRSYQFSASTVSISVDFETLNSVADYVKRLENSQYFSDAQISNVSNFEVSAGEGETSEKDKFNQIPRYKTNITMQINQTYLATGGAR